MSGLFRFTLDGFFDVQDQPRGWDSAKIVLERNDQYGGLFINYLTELEFWGDGYEYLNNIINTIGYCQPISVLVEYQCNSNSAFETVFNGFVNPQNIEQDVEKCIIKANLEADNIYSYFVNVSENQIPISILPNGILNGIFTHKVSEPEQVDSFVTNSPTLYNVLNTLINDYTNGDLTLVSDFFSNQVAQLERWTISFSGASLKPGDTIDVEYLTFFNKLITASVPFNGTVLQTLTDLGNVFINNLSLTQFSEAMADYHFDHTKWASYEVSGNDLILYAWLPMSAPKIEITGSAPLANVSVVQNTAYQKGGANLTLAPQIVESAGQFFGFKTIYNYFDFETPASQSTGTIINITSQTQNDFFISFKELFVALDKIFCLGMTIETTNNQKYLRIEPLEYFINSSSVLQINEPINITSEYDIEQDWNYVKTGSNTPSVLEISNVIVGNFATGNQGTNILNITTGDISMIGCYYLINNGTNFECVLVNNLVGNTLTLSQPLLFNHVNSDMASIKNGPDVYDVASTVNKKTVYKTINCRGKELDLDHGIILDITKHCTQIDFSFGTANYHGALSDKLSMISYVSGIGLPFSTRTPFMIVVNGITYTRWAYNWFLTNHHILLNNYQRIRQDLYWKPDLNSEFANQELVYKNNSQFKFYKYYKFSYYLTLPEINDLVQNPQNAIEILIGNQVVKCYIKRIEVDVNTKKANFELYEG